MKECRLFKIEGLVQGVYYRANTEKVARSMALTGWVRNTEDGGVECLACGELENLTAFEKWLNIGPDAARVDNVTSKKQDLLDLQSFDIRY